MRQPDPPQIHSPLLRPEGRRLLEWMIGHPQAPLFNFECGDYLRQDDLERLQALRLQAEQAWGWSPERAPAWVQRFAERVLEQVPHYRGYRATTFEQVPPLDKEVLRQSPGSLVPDNQDLTSLVVYDTSGTTGNRLLVPSSALVSASYLPLLQVGLASYGIELVAGSDQVALIQVGWQKATLTYASISAYLDQAGFAKLNLNPEQWREPQHRTAYIEACRPQIITGNPLSLSQLSQLGLNYQPKALVSSAMTLLPGTRKTLEARFNCPVFDLYAMTECTAIALKKDETSGHRLLAPDLYVEIFDDSGRPVAIGQRGEVALTGGRNPFLPLLRYRTRDHARLQLLQGKPTLLELEGRSPVQFSDSQGQTCNNIDLTHALAPLALVQFRVHQHRDTSLTLRYRGPEVQPEEVKDALQQLLGDLVIRVEQVAIEIDEKEKWIQFSSDLSSGNSPSL